MDPISALLVDIDRDWRPMRDGKIALHIIGASALLLQCDDYDRATKDSDVLETQALDGDVKTQLLALAGRDTPRARRHRLYIEMVPNGLPFLAHSPTWHRLTKLSDGLVHFDVQVLDVADVLVSKLARFSANDRSDIDAMIQRELVVHGQMLARFVAALDCAHGAHHRLRDCVANWHTVERDYFLVGETRVELPSWSDDS